MTGHPHAKLAQQYWAEAEHDAEAWRNWERNLHNNDPAKWQELLGPPHFSEVVQYRRRPETMTVEVPVFPAPMTEAPPVGTGYFVVVGSSHISGHTWSRDAIDFDRDLLASNICHSTREAAEQHLAAIQALNKMGRK